MRETEPKQVNSPYVFLGDILIKLEDVTSVTKYTRLSDDKGYFSIGVGGIDRTISGMKGRTQAARREILLMLGFAE